MATWAKGIDFKNSTDTARIGGVGMYGTDIVAEKLYLGLGSEPWNNNGIQITNDTIDFKGNKIYHAGDKPTPADIGAALSSHNHTSLTSVTSIGGAGASSSWGSLDITGSKGSWQGIHFKDYGYIWMVRNDGYTGMWKNGGSAVFAFDQNGTLATGTVPWGKISSIPTSFTPSAHNHSVLTGINDTRTIEYSPTTANVDFKTTFQSNGTNGVSDGGSFYSLMHVPRWTDSSGGYGSELAFTDNENIWYRRGTSNSVWGSWRQIWHSGNFDPASKASTSHTHSYLPLSGGSISGDFYVNNSKQPALAVRLSTNEIYSPKITVTGDYAAWLNQNGYTGVNITPDEISTPSLNSSGTISGNIVHASSNGQGTNFKIGDDCWLGDINEYATVKLHCTDGSGKGYLRFGNGAKIGYNGGAPLDLMGSLWVTENIFTQGGVSLAVSYSDRCDDSPWYGIGRAAIGLNTSERCVQVAGYYGVRMRSSHSFIDLNYNTYNSYVNGHWMPYNTRTYWVGANSPDRQWKGVCCEGGVVGASDIRFKENIERLDGTIVTFNELTSEISEYSVSHFRNNTRASSNDYYDFIKDRFKPTYYNYKLSTTANEETGEFDINPEDEYKMLKNIGFVAQDYDLITDKVAREFIFENDNGELSYNHMSYVTVGMIALQEATKKIETLENENKFLRIEIDNIKRYLNI